MRTLMDKINHFEQQTDGTVSDFNEIFTAKLEGLDEALQVEIGELADSDTTRWLTVGELIIKHRFIHKDDNEEELRNFTNVSYKLKHKPWEDLND